MTDCCEKYWAGWSGFRAMPYHGKVFVPTDSDRLSFAQVAGHELLHLKQEAPVLWLVLDASDQHLP